MTVEAFWLELKNRFGIEPFASGQNDTMICTDANQTQYIIPDPKAAPHDAARAALFAKVVRDLGLYVIPS